MSDVDWSLYLARQAGLRAEIASLGRGDRPASRRRARRRRICAARDGARRANATPRLAGRARIAGVRVAAAKPKRHVANQRLSGRGVPASAARRPGRGNFERGGGNKRAVNGILPTRFPPK